MREAFDSLRHSSDNLTDEGLLFVLLHHRKLFWSGFAYLQKGITGHLHNAWIGFPHELEQFSNDGLQKVPVQLQEIRILSHNVHDTWCNDCLILLPFLGLAKMQQGPQGVNEERTFLSLLDAAAEGTDDPRERVQLFKTEFVCLLLLYFTQDELLHLGPIILH